MPFNVGYYMEKNFLAAGFETNVREAVSMIANSVHELIVVMERGAPKGFVTVSDIVSKVITLGFDPAKLTLMEVMTTPYKVIGPDDDFMNAWKMIRDGAKLLVVVKNGIVCGIVTPSTVAMRFGEYTDWLTKGLLGNSMFMR